MITRHISKRMNNKPPCLGSEHFRLGNKQVLKSNEIKSFLKANSKVLGIPRMVSTQEAIETLLREKTLVKIDLIFGVRKEKRFILGQPHPHEVALLLRSGSYFTHQTALHLNGLITRAPKILYVNSEQPRKHRHDDQLGQESIDNAFRVQQRQSKSLLKYKGKEIRLLSGMNTNQLGVIEKQNTDGTILRYTDLERTLIDATVRPAYSGGVGEVFRAYKKAIDRLSLLRLVEYLSQLDYKYPYHQAIGFYLDQTGHFSEDQLKPLKQFGLNHNFYLSHAMKETSFNEDWRIYYPQEMRTIRH
jgi:predicted transcriptional regulator of viral defense system